jgi:hypothetical protein
MKDPAKAKKYHYTYLILNITNDMKYIGARSCDCLPKLDTKYMGSSWALTKIIKEEGLEHFLKIILVEFPSRDLALMHEVELHNEFNVNKNKGFYNKAKQTSHKFEYSVSGPDNPRFGKRPSEKSVEALMHYTLTVGRTEESIQKQKETMKGRNGGEENPFYGKHHDEETKKLLGDMSRKKIRPLEARRNMSKALSGEKSSQYGKPLPLKHRNSISEGLRNRETYIYVTPIGDFVYAREASKALQCSVKTVIRRCKDEFEGYALRPIENKYKAKKEEFKKLFDQGHKIAEISRMLGLPDVTLHGWRTSLEPPGSRIKKPLTKLTPTKVQEIRYLYDLGTPLKVIRKEFDLKKSQVHNIGSRNSWKSVPEESPPTSIDPDWQKNYCC